MHNEGLHSLCGCTRVGRRGGEALVGKPEGKKLLEDLYVDGSIILKYIWKYDGKAWIGFIWLMTWISSRLL